MFLENRDLGGSECGCSADGTGWEREVINNGILLKPTTLISILLKPTTKYDLFTRTDFSGTTERFWGSIVRYSSNRGTYICTVFICKFKYLYFIYTGIFFK